MQNYSFFGKWASGGRFILYNNCTNIVFDFICNSATAPLKCGLTLCLSNTWRGCRCSVLSATICNHLQPAFMGCLCLGRGVPSPGIWVAYVVDEASPLPVYGLQILAYLQPYLQPCKMFDVNWLWRYFGLGCRWQMKMKTIFL